MDLDGKKYFEKNEKGEIMLEGMIVIIITLFILIWILAVGFIYYQRYITNIVANDTAVKIASKSVSENAGEVLRKLKIFAT